MPVEIPGIGIEDDYVAVQGPAVELEAGKEPMDIMCLVLAAHANAGLDEADTHLNTNRRVGEHGAHDDVPMVDLAGDDTFLPG